MGDKRDRAKRLPPEQREVIETVFDESNSLVIGPPPPPITGEDLLRVFEKDYSAEDAAQLAGDLTPPNPGSFWSQSILLGVAELSPDHEARMRTYLGWTPERMQEELSKFRSR
jgi:hypothetical protein